MTINIIYKINFNMVYKFEEYLQHINEGIIGADGVSLYLGNGLQSIQGKQWDEKTAEEFVRAAAGGAMILDLDKNEFIKKTTLDTSLPIIVFPDWRTTPAKVAALSCDSFINKLLTDAGLAIECVKYYCLLGKRGTVVEQYNSIPQNIIDDAKNEIAEVIDSYTKKADTDDYLESEKWNILNDIIDVLKKYGIKTTKQAHFGRDWTWTYRSYYLIYKGKKTNVKLQLGIKDKYCEFSIRHFN
jgi:hypothetical protein